MKLTKGAASVISASFEPLQVFVRRLVRAMRESQKREIRKNKKTERRYISHIWGEAAVHTIATSFGLFGDLGDLINPTHFCVDRYSRFGATGGQFGGLP
jgi:hypothetical protein